MRIRTIAGWRYEDGEGKVDQEQAARYEACCRAAQQQARVGRRPCYVLVWVDGRVTWQQTLDRLDRLFAPRITRIDPDGRRTIETARLRTVR